MESTSMGQRGPLPPADAHFGPAGAARRAAGYRVVRRNGSVTEFDPGKIVVAMTKAFLAEEGGGAAASSRVHRRVEELTAEIVAAVTRRLEPGGAIHIEDIQDQVELALMRAGEHKVARAYILYREAHAEQRRSAAPSARETSIRVAVNGALEPLGTDALRERIAGACRGLDDVDVDLVLEQTMPLLFDGIDEREIEPALMMGVRPLIERDPGYGRVAARLLLASLWAEAAEAVPAATVRSYAEYFPAYVAAGVELELLDPRFAELDLERLGAALDAGRDDQFMYLGLKTLYDRYLLRSGKGRIELPQAFFMRVAIGLALNETDREGRALEFYALLSSFDFMCSTPTLFNAGTLKSQLSSCYLTSVPDDLDGIYTALKDNALLSKFAGGLGNDWTRVRAMGAHIKGTNGASQGVVPFLKVANDTAVAVNQGGKRKGAVCAYLETWHLDVEEFLELRKNTGDERRRTHDMHTAHWIPDLFMRRVEQDGHWTLFSPSDVPDLHDLYGRDFERAYTAYEARAERGEIELYKRVGAVALWRRMLSMLYETGHPWITFKDACNLRSPQRHAGIVHCSNLCTEITLNTSDDEIAVCNLGSVNLARHVAGGRLDAARLERTVATAMRMLDNVIDLNLYSVEAARRSNLRHRPVGLGLMGWQDFLYRLRVPIDSDEAVDLADRVMEALSFDAIHASVGLARERGAYPSFDGSAWSRGQLPIDTLEVLEAERGGLEVDRSASLDWPGLREAVRAHGMRNSNCLAIAPTATISNIVGTSQSIEPAFRNLYVKSNLSGEFTVINPYLVADLKQRGLWDAVMVNDLKYFDGALGPIARVPEDLKALYATAFEVDQQRLVQAAARRQKWIDQSQSLNLYMAEPSGSALDRLYRSAWRQGLKTTYYLRTTAASRVERSTVAEPERGAGPPMNGGTAACRADAPDCEACQ